MTNNRNDRDQELETLLAPLRDESPSEEMLARWSAAVRSADKDMEPRPRNRIVEWAIAASIGFAAASALGLLKRHVPTETQDPIGIAAEHSGYNGIDATEMKLVAK